MNTKEYIVVPFRPKVKSGALLADVANQVHEVLMSHVSKGWNYVGMETIEFDLQGGLLEGKQNGRAQMMIFDK